MKGPWAKLAGLGFELTGLLIGGFLLGQALDRWQGWSGWGVALGISLGFFGWLIHVYKVLQDSSAEDDLAENTSGEPPAQ